MGSLVTSTPAKIMAVSEMPGSLVASCWGGRWWSCRYTWSFSGPTPLKRSRRELQKVTAVSFVVSRHVYLHALMGLTHSHTEFIPALSDLYCHGARHHISRGQIFGVGCIALHETLSLTVDQDASLTTAALCDQTTSSVDAWEDSHIFSMSACMKFSLVARTEF